MFLANVLEGEFAGSAYGEAGIVDAGWPPSESDAACCPYNFAEAGCVAGGEGCYSFVEAVVSAECFEGFAFVCGMISFHIDFISY